MTPIAPRSRLLKDGVREAFNQPVMKKAYDNWCASPFRGHVVQ